MLMKLPVQVLQSRLAATTPHRFGARRIIIMLNCAMKAAGMVRLKSVLSRDDVTAIRGSAKGDETPASRSEQRAP